MNRRSFLRTSTLAAPVLAFPVSGPSLFPTAARRFSISLKADAIGVNGPVINLMKRAAEIGFEAIALPSEEILALGQSKRKRLAAQAKDLGLQWGSAGLPVDFRRDQATFERDLARLPEHGRAMIEAGIKRVGTWIMPGNDDYPYLENLELHATRLRTVAKVMADHGVRLGLEYVGPLTLRNAFPHAFIRNGQQLKELVEAIDADNVGVILDSFHWYCAGETKEDLRIWRNEDVIAVDLNDADRTLGQLEQIDGNRELPGATGKIDIADFVDFLKEISYDGPVRAEPFNATLNAMDDDLAMQATYQAVKGVVGD